MAMGDRLEIRSLIHEWFIMHDHASSIASCKALFAIIYYSQACMRIINVIIFLYIIIIIVEDVELLLVL